MIRRSREDGWELVRQPDHGALAGDLLAALADGPRGPSAGFAAAVAHHDDGWVARDREVREGPDGGPETFLDLPLAEHLALSEASVRLAGERDPYAEAVVASHVAWLHGARPVAGPEAAEERDRIVAEWRATAVVQAASVGVGVDALTHDQQLCALVDLLSLWLCGWPEADTLALERPGGGEVDAERRADAVSISGGLLLHQTVVFVPVLRVEREAPFAEHGADVRLMRLEPVA